MFLLAALAFGFFLYSNWQTLHKPFTHDEVDYVVCAEKGVWHNAVGDSTLGLREFVHLGKLKKNKHRLVGHFNEKKNYNCR